MKINLYTDFLHPDQDYPSIYYKQLVPLLYTDDNQRDIKMYGLMNVNYPSNFLHFQSIVDQVLHKVVSVKYEHKSIYKIKKK